MITTARTAVVNFLRGNPEQSYYDVADAIVKSVNFARSTLQDMEKRGHVTVVGKLTDTPVYSCTQENYALYLSGKSLTEPVARKRKDMKPRNSDVVTRDPLVAALFGKAK